MNNVPVSPTNTDPHLCASACVSVDPAATRTASDRARSGPYAASSQTRRLVRPHYTSPPRSRSRRRRTPSRRGSRWCRCRGYSSDSARPSRGDGRPSCARGSDGGRRRTRRTGSTCTAGWRCHRAPDRIQHNECYFQTIVVNLVMYYNSDKN